MTTCSPVLACCLTEPKDEVDVDAAEAAAASFSSLAGGAVAGAAGAYGGTD